MAVTINNLPAGNRGKRWLVTFGDDADVVATIQHGLIDAPELVIGPTPLNAEAYVGQVARQSVTATNIVLSKANAVGSGGAQVEVIAYRPNSGF